MKRRRGFWGTILFLCLLIPAFALAQTACVTCEGDALDRVKLRQKPSPQATVLGKYFRGVQAEVLDESSGWAHIRIGNREGYMMRQYLTTQTAADEGLDCMLYRADQETPLPLYTLPSNSSPVLAELNTLWLTVLGTIDEDWAQVRCTLPNGETVTGYTFSRDICLPQPFNTARITSERLENRLNLREKPEQAAYSLGRYYAGTEVYCLLDDSPNLDGWTRVRIADRVGYVMDEYLSYDSGGSYPVYPPLTYALLDGTPLYDTAFTQEPTGSVDAGEAMVVLGLVDSRYCVQLAKGTGRQRYRYVDRVAVQLIDRAASAEGTLKKSQMLYYSAGENTSLQPWEITAPAGARLYVMGTYDEVEFSVPSPYIDREEAWLYCSIEVEKNSYYFAFVPLDAVTYDEAMAFRIPALETDTSK